MPSSIMVTEVKGATGNGNQALAASVGTVFREARIPTVDTLNRCTLAVSGKVTMQPEAGGDRVQIVWHVHDADGRILGEIAQVSTVPSGSLRGLWGTDARQAALGARNGIVDIMRRKRSGCI